MKSTFNTIATNKSYFDSSPDNNANKVVQFDLLRFCPILSSLALYFQRCAHFYMQSIFLLLIGISTLKPVLRNIANSQRNRRKPLKNNAEKKEK